MIWDNRPGSGVKKYSYETARYPDYRDRGQRGVSACLAEVSLDPCVTPAVFLGGDSVPGSWLIGG